MQLLSKKIVVENINIEITVHDLSFRMGFREGEIPTDHMYVRLIAWDSAGVKLWETPFLAEDGKIKAFSSVQEAFADVFNRLSSVQPDLVRNGLGRR